MKKQDTFSERLWKKVGETKKGEAIRKSILGHLAVERDHMYLCQMTDQEKKDMEEARR